MKQDKIYGIIISAGLSGRMMNFKPLLSYKGKSFIQHIVLKLNPVCDKIIIVTGYNTTQVEENVNQLNLSAKIEFVYNEDYEKGMFTSLQTGLAKAFEGDWLLYHFVDQPGLPEKFYPDFIEQIDDKHNWVQPKTGERKGHPLLIKKELFRIIIDAPFNSNLRMVSKNPKVSKKYWECAYPEIFQDIDTEEDYLKLN